MRLETVESMYKLALDPVSGRVFWTTDLRSGPETIDFANANNSGGGGTLNLAGASAPESIRGMAVDPEQPHLLAGSRRKGLFASLAAVAAAI